MRTQARILFYVIHIGPGSGPPIPMGWLGSLRRLDTRFFFATVNSNAFVYEWMNKIKVPIM